jgi:hypothetical protein
VFEHRVRAPVGQFTTTALRDSVAAQDFPVLGQHVLMDVDAAGHEPFFLVVTRVASTMMPSSPPTMPRRAAVPPYCCG